MRKADTIPQARGQGKVGSCGRCLYKEGEGALEKAFRGFSTKMLPKWVVKKKWRGCGGRMMFGEFVKAFSITEPTLSRSCRLRERSVGPAYLLVQLGPSARM